METRLLVSQFIRPLSFAFLLILAAPEISVAKENNHRNIRFYKVNKTLQADRIRFTKKKSAQVGCHNFLKKSRVHRVVQIGYGSCSLFTKKHCVADSIVTARQEKDETQASLLTQGFGWFPESDNPRGAKIRSWSCTLSVPEPPNEPKD